MKQFIKENRTFLIVAFTITLLSLFKVGAAHAQTNPWVQLSPDYWLNSTVSLSSSNASRLVQVIESRIINNEGKALAATTITIYQVGCTEKKIRAINTAYIANDDIYPQKGETEWFDASNKNTLAGKIVSASCHK